MEGHIPAYYSDVSPRLFNVLDKVGLREDIRWKRINMMFQADEIESMVSKIPHHIFGSQAEATTTRGLQSDLDIIVCLPNIGVRQSIPSLETSEFTYIMVSDASTPPGYVKLQMLDRDSSLPLFNVQSKAHSLDSFGRSVLCSRNFCSTDYVMAVRVRFWPCQVSQWENRTNSYPSQANIGLIKQTGALLVPVGHPLSPESHLEWRISISYGEKILVWQFNSTQYKCYVLLKMIRKHFVQPICGEKALSSYHCKACVFYALQSTPSSQWEPENLLLCVELCLRTLCQWVKIGYCPNYFIPGENMFHGKMYGHIQVQLLAVIRDRLRQEGKYLLMLSCDDIGQRLARLCQTSLIDSVNQVKDGVEYMGLGSDLASQCLAQDVIDQEGLYIAHELLALGCSSDVTSGSLKLAAFYLMQDNFIMAEGVLHQIQENYTHLVTDCKTYPPEEVLCKILVDNLSTAEVLRQYVAFPVSYFNSEMYCMPKALILKMFLSRGSHIPAQSACVDPTFFLHYLEYQCFFRQGKTSHKMVALDNMLWVVFYKHLEYRDSALSLLASCLMQEGMNMNAWKVLCMSMRLQNEHSAAMWQIAVLINGAFRLLRQRQ